MATVDEEDQSTLSPSSSSWWLKVKNIGYSIYDNVEFASEVLVEFLGLHKGKYDEMVEEHQMRLQDEERRRKALTMHTRTQEMQRLQHEANNEAQLLECPSEDMSLST
eukprot:GILK01004800.1.p2 GENE.GILK01004800.1~~GILK01004800.1.p2  ORF type:complete len:120 (+),score=23.54 GILK01004800.1:38-361(+)